MRTINIDPRSECLDDSVHLMGAELPDDHVPAQHEATAHRATIASTTWVPASDTVTALLAATLTASH